MTLLVGITNLILGLAYCGYGVMTSLEMKRDWKTFGFSHFGAAWILMAFTCGPHHLVHGIHTLVEGRVGQPLDALAVIVGLPFGVVWLSLRVEAFFGGRGDRFIARTPTWLRMAPAFAVVYSFVLIASVATLMRSHHVHFESIIAANILLIVVYNAIAWILLRTQLRNHDQLNGWSLSGVTLTAVFPTCALMHAVYAVYASTQLYAYDVHGSFIDWLSIPGGLYFLWVVHGLYKGTRADWNDEAGEPEPMPALV